MTNPPSTTERFVDVPGGKVYVKQWTPGNVAKALPILLLHDSLGCIEMWREFPQQVCERTGRVVIAYDRLGFGQSSRRNELPSNRFMYEEAEIYLPIILKSLGIESFILLGHSVGGAMAVICAGFFGEQCKAVITEAAQVYVEERTREGIIQAKTEFQNPDVFAKLEKYHADKAQWLLDAWINIWMSRDFDDWSLKADLPKVRCPILAIHGDRDEYGSGRFPEMICQLAGGTAENMFL